MEKGDWWKVLLALPVVLLVSGVVWGVFLWFFTGEWLELLR